ncbi:transcriptional regulator, LacI family [Paenibacillus curdlanolyticus YK9]|uniref:Transcriptional regulator, LacI family n=1 Tax=Paenibacillus curdlanolyticus YK9 TaxID=717606 RepID=E0I9R7_9BACL|nr:LacI family DNA-binding transcriptional regulator [Paenibacillus curdlanolyticus]EFM11151.1 transcriptional regulator, LacI family [Paenibacillus curdlanolyticus YK9]
MKITIKKIAELAGVSVSTVSKILNNYDDVSAETKERVHKIIEAYGYSTAYSSKASASRKFNLIGVVYAGKINAEFNHLFFVDVMNAFKKRMGLLGYDLIFFSNERLDESEGDYLSRCRRYQVDGCIIISGDEIEADIAELDQSDIPCIGIDLPLTGNRSGYVMSDNTNIAYKAVEHFYLQGYRELGFIGCSDASQISRNREQAYREALQSYGLPIIEPYFVNGTDFFMQTGYQAMMQMIEKGTVPRAIFAASDLLAICAVRALQDKGYKVPEDVAVIGCDDIEACKHVSPPLTTVRQDKDKIGLLAALMLYDLIHGQLQSSSVMVAPELVVRRSCGAEA